MQKDLSRYVKSQLVCIEEGQPLSLARDLMVSNEIRHLPVVNPDRFVVGILSDRDLLRAQLPPNVTFVGSELRFPPNARVTDFMTSPVQTISIDGDLTTVVDEMIEHRISSCLVEKGGEIVGIITHQDLLHLLKNYISTPQGSIRSAIEQLVFRSPLGSLAATLANSGI